MKLAASENKREHQAALASQNDARACTSEARVVELQGIIAHLSVEEGKLRSAVESKDAALDKQRDRNNQLSTQLDELRERMITIQDRAEVKVQSAKAELHAMLTNMVDHSRKVFNLAKRLSMKTGNASDEEQQDLAELGMAQKEIEALTVRANK